MSEQRLSDLEARIVKLEKEAAAATTAEQTIEAINNVIQKYLELQIKVFTALEKGETIDRDALYAANDSIRILHHIVKIKGLV
ncbi:hypothetical protein [Anoxybacillus ayderensis]|uniref:Uncharacterized protein n=1 Tax=Anoxybacillus flavithermus TaxID=33934 RepID=A0A094J2V2_9BACL|nr:hypothetical protein [Anoxybacillus ayderensis]KFZ32349.1 hypothetical protein JS44_10550 [Anoxybacillus flavithermus]KHF27810.1 hypothetical protein LR68_03361 [Anoxybacillus sp. BCO1]MED0687927.1 hypothetical protein [Anoxybacillus ayderensis]